MADSPGSPLSSHGSSEFTEDVKFEDGDASIDPFATVPAAKRQRTGLSSYRSTPQLEVFDGEISSDTSGSAPSSPVAAPALVMDDDNTEQVTICRWRKCEAGDLKNTDALVQHIREEHIDNLNTKIKKYMCEWDGCSRQDNPITTAYALKSHMRGHTREKPFYCALPGEQLLSICCLRLMLSSIECDKFFNRSDALTKHLRTVHETETLRQADPPPRINPPASSKPQKLKLTFKKGHASENGLEGDEDTIPEDGDGVFSYPTDIKFTEEEQAMSPDQLFKLLRRQIYWSEQEGERLKKECTDLEAVLKKEWLSKELVLANVIEAELASGLEGSRTTEDLNVAEMVSALLPTEMLPLSGETPWYRQPRSDSGT
jgi:hypothetical protein